MKAAHRTITLTLTLVAVWLAVTGLVAHMAYRESQPAANTTIAEPPPQVRVWFTEPPDPAVSRLAMSGPSGPVALADFQAMDDRSLMAMVEDAQPMPDGEYSVEWQSAGNDGHVQRGTFTFTLQRAE